MFETVFCATSATIVSGAMAERTKFSMYCVYSFFISLIIYPVEGHWTWGGGWLLQQQTGSFMMNTFGAAFHDFAGSAIVHSVGGKICLGWCYLLRSLVWVSIATARVWLSWSQPHGCCPGRIHPLVRLVRFQPWFSACCFW